MPRQRGLFLRRRIRWAKLKIPPLARDGDFHTISTAVEILVRDDFLMNLWDKILQHMERRVNPHSFTTWFRPTRQQGVENGKLLIKPGAKAIKRFRNRLAKEFHAQRGSNVAAVLATITPVIRGWVAYYRTVVSSSVFHALTGYLWKLTYKWATWRHKNKPKHWIAGRYFGKFNKFRNDHWVFGDRDTGAYMVRFSWTAIERHVPVKGAASPDDPSLASYWAGRRKKVKPPLDRYSLRLLSRQDGLCPLCGDHLLSAAQPPQSPRQWEQWWLHVTRKAIAASYLTHGRPGPADGDQTRLVHASCQRALHARQRPKPALQPATPSRLA